MEHAKLLTTSLCYGNTNVTEKIAFVQHQNRWEAVSFGDGYPEPYARLSVVLPVEPAEGCFFLKNWSEGQPIAKFLEDEKLIEFTGREVLSAHVLVPEVRPTEKFMALLCTDSELSEISQAASGPEI